MDQYEKQFMFGDPVPVDSIPDAKDNSFFLVWSYSAKVADIGSDVSNDFGEAPAPKDIEFPRWAPRAHSFLLFKY